MHGETVDLLSSLVAIDSVNPALVPGGAGEAAWADAAFIAAVTETLIDVPRTFCT